MGEPQRTYSDYRRVSAAIRRAYDSFERKRFPKMGDITVGQVEGRMKRYAKANNIEMAKGGLVLNIKKFSHMVRREKKRINKAVGREGWASFPKEYKTMRLFWDGDKQNFVYVGGGNKFIVEPNKLLNSPRKRVVLITGI